VAKNLVASGLCDRAEVQVAYAIGVPEPVSIMVDTKGTGKVSDQKLTHLVRKHFDLSPRGLIQTLKLRRPIYRLTAAYGHFGRTDIDLPWERLDKVEDLKSSV
jgi:S-adenosylmethionine synthetase